MKTTFKILLFFICLNLATGMVIELSLAGTEYVQATTPSNASDYESHFNASDVAKGWGASPYSGIPIIGDIFSAFQMLWRIFEYVIAGFPLFLIWVGDSFIIDASARLAFNIISGVLVAMQAVLTTVFFLEFIWGREMTD